MVTVGSVLLALAVGVTLRLLLRRSIAVIAMTLVVVVAAGALLQRATGST